MPGTFTPSGTDHIIKLLLQNADLSAQEIINRLAKQKIKVALGLIYTVRSGFKAGQFDDRIATLRRQIAEEEAAKKADRIAALRRQIAEAAEKNHRQSAMQAKAKATRAANKLSLREHVQQVLSNGQGLTAREIANQCRKEGYKHQSANHMSDLCKKLRLMVEKGQLIRNPRTRTYTIVHPEQLVRNKIPAKTVDDVVKAYEDKNLSQQELQEVCQLAKEIGLVKVETYLNFLKDVEAVRVQT